MQMTDLRWQSWIGTARGQLASNLSSDGARRPSHHCTVEIRREASQTRLRYGKANIGIPVLISPSLGEALCPDRLDLTHV